ncbi:MAG: hypothetical protein EU536_00895 [Promethearchaeota archaeon]|nr:MAG: hypothetical protein EU536_00895 [Candidatus Lokiarchaeota archaeon]
MFKKQLKTCLGFGYQNYTIVAFWSKPIINLVANILAEKGRAFAAHHDRGLECINSLLFQSQGAFQREFREAGRKYHDLKVPLKHPRTHNVIIEYKLRSSGLEFLRDELKNRQEIFARNDWFCFSFFLRREPKDKSKSLKELQCTYYLVIILFSKVIENLNLRDLVDDIKMDSDEFIREKLKQASGVKESEELRPIENIITVVELESRLEEKDKQLEEKDKQLEEKDKQLEEKDEQIKYLKDQLK